MGSRHPDSVSCACAASHFPDEPPPYPPFLLFSSKHFIFLSMSQKFSFAPTETSDKRQEWVPSGMYGSICFWMPYIICKNTKGTMENSTLHACMKMPQRSLLSDIINICLKKNKTPLCAEYSAKWMSIYKCLSLLRLPQQNSIHYRSESTEIYFLIVLGSPKLKNHMAMFLVPGSSLIAISCMAFLQCR